MNQVLSLSYQQCQDISERSGSNFLLAFRSLSRPRYRAMMAVYAFMHRLDNLADSDAPVEERREKLEDFQGDFLRFVNGFQASVTVNFHNHVTGIFPAVVDTLRNYRIPMEYVTSLFEGIFSDLDKSSYANSVELEAYCYNVASVVGLICMHILGAAPAWISPEADTPLKRAAIACGKAFQMTNILRDVVEDAERGRVYLPLDGRDLETVRSAILDGNEAFLRPILEKNIRWTESFYAACADLPRGVPFSSVEILWTMLAVYLRLYKKIRRRPMIVLRKRVRVTRLEKLFLLFWRFFWGNSIPALLPKRGKTFTMGK